MNITEYCDVLNLELDVKYYPNQGCRWSASIRHAEVKDSPDSSILSSCFGDGATPENAIISHVSRIRGKLLVVDAYKKSRREYMVPLDLEGWQ